MESTWFFRLENQVKDTYGFKSSKCPPSVNELSSFESDLVITTHNVEFQPVKNRFLSKLKKDVKTIKNTKLIPISHLIFIKWIKIHTRIIFVKMSPKHIRNQTETKSTKSILRQRRSTQS